MKMYMNKELALEINDEINRAFKKHGYQDVPSVDSVLSNRIACAPERMCEEYEIPSEIRAKFLCDNAFKKGELTHTHIVLEEFAEVVCAKDDNERRKELIQLLAMCTNWINYIDEKALTV